MTLLAHPIPVLPRLQKIDWDKDGMPVLGTPQKGGTNGKGHPVPLFIKNRTNYRLYSEGRDKNASFLPSQ